MGRSLGRAAGAAAALSLVLAAPAAARAQASQVVVVTDGDLRGESPLVRRVAARLPHGFARAASDASLLAQLHDDPGPDPSLERVAAVLEEARNAYLAQDFLGVLERVDRLSTTERIALADEAGAPLARELRLLGARAALAGGDPGRAERYLLGAMSALADHPLEAGTVEPPVVELAAALRQRLAALPEYELELELEAPMRIQLDGALASYRRASRATRVRLTLAAGPHRLLLTRAGARPVLLEVERAGRHRVRLAPEPIAATLARVARRRAEAARTGHSIGGIDVDGDDVLLAIVRASGAGSAVVVEPSGDGVELRWLDAELGRFRRRAVARDLGPAELDRALAVVLDVRREEDDTLRNVLLASGGGVLVVGLVVLLVVAAQPSPSGRVVFE